MLPIAEVLDEKPPEYHIDMKGHFKSGSCVETPSTKNTNWKIIRDLILEWLFDSGRGLDVIGLEELNDFLDDLFELPKTLTVWAANGQAIAKYQVRIYIAAFNEVIEPYVVKDSLNLLSIGKRAEKHGWDVRWKP